MHPATTSEQADEYLAVCTQAALAGLPCPPWPFCAADGEMAGLVASRAAFHGISPLLGHAPEPFAGWPDDAAAPLRDEMRLAVLWEELHRPRIAEVIERLAMAGVETMVMKGTALAYLHYADPSARRRGDTDMLIHFDDLATTRKVLEQAGCRCSDGPLGLFYQETWVFDGGAGMQHAIDLHWEPVDRPVLQKIAASERYWSGKVAIPRLSQHAQGPDALQMLVHGAINQAWHVERGFQVDDAKVFGGSRLIWSVDYLRICNDFSPQDWDRMVAYCAEHDASALVHAALAGAQRDLGLVVPAGIMERLAADGADSRAARYLANGSPIADFLENFRAAPSLSSRWLMFSVMAFPPRSHLEAKYPRFANWPVFLLHLLRYREALRRLRDGEGRR